MTANTSKTETGSQGRQHSTHQDQFGLERLVFFSDAVFAIAITLLALEIRLPATEQVMSEAMLRRALADLWPKYLSYVVSFLVIGAFWLGHHRKFRLIERYDRRLLWLNLLMLMTVAFIPFPTSVISEYGNTTGTIFYAASMAVSGLMLVALWSYASHHNRLVNPHLDRRQRRLETWRTLMVPAIFLLSIGIALFNDDLAKFSWILIAPASLLLR